MNPAKVRVGRGDGAGLVGKRRRKTRAKRRRRRRFRRKSAITYTR